MFLAKINNYEDDLLDSLDEMSVMLDEWNEGIVENIGKWLVKPLPRPRPSPIARRKKPFLSRVAYLIVKKGGQVAINFC